MITFFVALLTLLVGFYTYGKFVDNNFRPTDAPTPANTMRDDVDYMPLPTPKVFLVQLLNIAGLGPIFGALAGALWGPVVYFWIVLGTIFSGAVHDYLAGMISLRLGGASISEVIGKYLGNTARNVMTGFSVMLLIMIGTIFVTGPAMMLSKMTGAAVIVCVAAIIIYYFLATMLPINKIISKIYPVFGISILVMAFGIIGGLLTQGYHIPEMTLANLHPKHLPIWPLMFITVACGATSGFHATQSPMMARCLTDERNGHKVFYGAMVCEGIIALIWAAAGVSFYESPNALGAALAKGGPGAVVYEIAISTMGTVGGALAMLGVVACPITSGDTAFRSARLTIADWLHLEQTSLPSRLKITVPLMIVCTIVSQMNFGVIWRYTSWANQVMAMMALWAGAAYLSTQKRNFWIAAIPAIFMSAVSSTYILMAPEGLQLSPAISYTGGAIFAGISAALFFTKANK